MAVVRTFLYFIVLVVVTHAITNEPKLILELLKSGFGLPNAMVDRLSVFKRLFFLGMRLS